MLHFNRSVITLSLAGVVSVATLAETGCFSSAWALSDSGLKLYTEGMELLNAGQPQGALNRFEAALSKSPEDLVLHQVLGETYSQLGQHQSALVHYQQILQLSPRDTGALLGIGRALEALEQYPKALDAYAAILNIQPDYAYAHYAIAQVELKQQHWPMAINALQRFLQTYPQHTEARRQLANAYKSNRQPEKAVEVFEALSADFPAQFTDALPLARAYNASNEPDKALKVLLDSQNKVVDLSPEFQNELGYAYLTTNNVGFAKEAFARALQQSPDNPATQLGLAQAYLKSEQADSAVPLFQKYLTQFPNDSVAKQQLGLAYVQSGQFTQAIETLTPLLNASATTQSAEDTYWLTSHLALAHQSLETPEHMQQAIRLYQTIRPQATEKGDTTVLKNLALAYHQSGQLPQAVGLYETLLNQPDVANTDTLKGDAARAMVAAANDALSRNDTHTAQLWLTKAKSLSANAEQPIPELSLLEASLNTALYHQQLASQPNVQAPAVAEAYHTALASYQAALAQWPNQPQITADYVLLLLAPPVGQPSPELTAQAAQLIAQAKTAASPSSENSNLTPAPLLLAEANLLNVQNKPQQAITAYQQFLHHPDLSLSMPDKAQHWVTLAQWQQAHKQPAEALTSYQTATQLDTSNVAAWTNLATLHAQQQQWNKAKSAYQQALQANRTYPTALYGLAVTYDQLKETPQAIQQYSAYLASGDTQYADATRTRLAVLAPSGMPQTPTPAITAPDVSTPASHPEPQHPVAVQPATLQPQTTQTVVPGQPMEFTLGNGANPMTIRLNVGEITVPANLAPAIPLQYDAEPMDD